MCSMKPILHMYKKQKKYTIKKEHYRLLSLRNIDAKHFNKLAEWPTL
jgi:hypothetical protein